MVTVLLLVCASLTAIITHALPLTTRFQRDDVIVTSSTIILLHTDQSIVKSAKRIAHVTWYKVDPSRSQSPQYAAILMSSSPKDINLMILPMSSIIVLTVLLSIRVSRWCVEDVREADESTVVHRIHDVMMTSSELTKRIRRMSNDYVEAKFSATGLILSSSSKSVVASRNNAAKLNRTMTSVKRNGQLTADAGQRPRHGTARTTRLRAHTADGRRRDGMSTTSIPLAELLSTTAAPLIRGVRPDSGRLVRQAGTADDIVERCRRAGGHGHGPTEIVTHRSRKRNYSSPASTSPHSSTTTASSWCSDTRPLVRLQPTSRSTSTSTCTDRLITSSDSTIDVSTTDLITSSSPQLVRGSCCQRGDALKMPTASGGRPRHVTTGSKHQVTERRCRQQAPAVSVSKLVQDSFSLSLRFFRIPVDGAQSSAVPVVTSADNLLRDSADSVFVCSISTDNDDTCIVAPAVPVDSVTSQQLLIVDDVNTAAVTSLETRQNSISAILPHDESV